VRRCRKARGREAKRGVVARQKGIDAVFPFRAMLADLIVQIEANRQLPEI